MQSGGPINNCSRSRLKQNVNRFCDMQGNVNIDQLFEDIKELSGMIIEVLWFYKAFIFGIYAKIFTDEMIGCVVFASK